LWIGTNAAGLSRFAGGRFTSVTREQGLGSNLVMALLVDREDALWVGTDGGGLTRVKQGALETFSTRHGLAADSVLSLYEDAQGVLWIGTSGGGLSRLQQGRFASFSTRDGLHDDVVFAIQEDSRGGLWLSAIAAFSRVEKRLLVPGARVAPQVFGVADGMKSAECSGVAQPAATRLPGGELVFPTPRGIVVLDPQHLPKNEVPPPVHVEELLAGGRTYAGPRASLPRGASNWEIRFTGLSLLAPERVRFLYRLSGFEPDWVDAGARRSAFYTQVPPGEYQFEVRAANNDGVFSREPARLLISVAAAPARDAAVSAVRWRSGWCCSGRWLRRARARARVAPARAGAAGARAHRALSEQQRRTEHAREEAERQRERGGTPARAGAASGRGAHRDAADRRARPQEPAAARARPCRDGPARARARQAGGRVRRAHPLRGGAHAGDRDAAARRVGCGGRPDHAQDPAARPGDVARHVVEASRAAAARKGQELHLSIEGELPVRWTRSARSRCSRTWSATRSSTLRSSRRSPWWRAARRSARWST
jgi:hypothetical protein